MSATVMPILMLEATPVFCDINKKNFNICPISIKKMITKKTKAIILVSLFGLPNQYDLIKKVLSNIKQKIYIIEDSAESLLATYQNKPAGNFGDFTMYSMQASKHITSGDGGILTTNNKILFKKAKMISNLGYGLKKISYLKKRSLLEKPSYTRHFSFGYNYRMPEICAAIAFGQATRAKRLVSKRIKAGLDFKKIAEKFKFISTQEINKKLSHSYWTFCIFLESKILNTKIFAKHFKKFGGDFFYATWKIPYNEPFMKNFFYKKDNCINAEIFQKNAIQLKTNYWEKKELNKQLVAFKKTLNFFNKKYFK